MTDREFLNEMWPRWTTAAYRIVTWRLHPPNLQYDVVMIEWGYREAHWRVEVPLRDQLLLDLWRCSKNFVGRLRRSYEPDDSVPESYVPSYWSQVILEQCIDTWIVNSPNILR